MAATPATEIWVASLTLMDSTAVKIPVNQITGYSEQYESVVNPTPPPASITQFKQSVIQLTNNQTIVVQENAAAVQAAITAAVKIFG